MVTKLSGNSQEENLPNHLISDLHAPRCFGSFASQVFKALTALSKQTVPAAAVGAAPWSAQLLCPFQQPQQEKVHGVLQNISAWK